MRNKTKKAKRHVMSKLYTDIMNKKANSDATLTLRREIFRLARIRDILGIAFIVSVLVILVLSFLLYRRW
jgi:hypothetical protein